MLNKSQKLKLLRSEMAGVEHQLRVAEEYVERLKRDLAKYKEGWELLRPLAPWCDYWRARALLAEGRLAALEPKKEVVT